MGNLFRCAGAGGEDIKCIERPYNSNDIYNTGDTAMYNGLLRICTADGVTGEFDVSKWEVTTLDELLGENIGENDALVDYIASEYDPTHTYMTGDAILGDNAEILKCLEDEVTGEFDNSKWSRDYLCNLSGNVNSNLYGKECGDGTTKKCVSGSFVCDGVVPKTIKCDFKPSHITMHVYRNDLNVTYTTLLVYDGDINPDKVYRSGGSGAVAENLATQFTLNDDGFTINNIKGNQTSNSYTTKWVAYE